MLTVNDDAVEADLPHTAVWRDIADAPKDGRTILVARHMGDFGWVLGTSYWEDIRGISGWISKGTGLFGELGLGNPTHWLPLPPAPGSTTSLPLTEAQIRADERERAAKIADESVRRAQEQIIENDAYAKRIGKPPHSVANEFCQHSIYTASSIAGDIRRSAPPTAGSAE